MKPYTINLPIELLRDAVQLAREQGGSVDQFILDAVAEKVANLRQGLDDLKFPNIKYRRGAAGSLSPVLSGTGIRVQTIVISSENMSPTETAENYNLTVEQVQEALNFYRAHHAEIDALIQAEAALEPKNRSDRRVG